MTTPPHALSSDTGSPTATQITNTSLLTALRVLWFTVLGWYLIQTIFFYLPTSVTGVGIDPVSLARWETNGIRQLALIFLTSLGTLNAVAILLLSTLLLWRTRNERTALLFAFVLLPMLPIAYFAPSTLPDVIVKSNATGFLLTFTTIVYLFPSAHFMPRWMRYPFALIVIVLLAHTVLMLPDSALDFIFTPYLVMFLVGLGSFVYRFRKATPAQRQQFKWLLPALMLLGCVFIAWIVPGLLGGFDSDINSIQFDILYVISVTSFITLPIAIGLSVLRYRLWEIDLVINRSLVYGLVTVGLGIIFFISVFALQSLLGGANPLVALAMSAVIPALLFNPARKRAQNLVDRYIYRLRYDLNEVAAAQKKPDVKNPGLYTGRTFGKYEILGVLGKGGMGEVYKGFGDGQTVAVKVLPEDLARKDEFRKRFTREAQTLASLAHPNIVKLYDSGVTDDGVHYLAMEYIDGDELSEVVHQGAITDYHALHEWLTSVASALDYIHEKGLVHRDLKPSNIMLRASIRDAEIKEAVLMDFGIARVDATGTRITGSGAVGTIDYMSPEQIMAAREVDKRSDVYSLGIIVYELLTGERPFKGGAGQVLFAHLQQPPPDPRDTNSAVPRAIAHAVLKALAKNADDRFSSAGEFAAALQ